MPSTIKTLARVAKQARKSLPNAIRTLNDGATALDNAIAVGKEASSLARDLADRLRAMLPASKELAKPQTPVRPATKRK